MTDITSFLCFSRFVVYMYIGNARCSEVGAITEHGCERYTRIRLADSMLTGTTNSSRIEPVFVGSDDYQVIENMRSIVLALLAMTFRQLSTVL